MISTTGAAEPMIQKPRRSDWFALDVKTAKLKFVWSHHLLRSYPDNPNLKEIARAAKQEYERLLRKTQDMASNKDRILDQDLVKFRGLSLVYNYWFRERVNRVKTQWRSAVIRACERVIKNRLYIMMHENYVLNHLTRVTRTFQERRRVSKRVFRELVREIGHSPSWRLFGFSRFPQSDKERELFEYCTHEVKIQDWHKGADGFRQAPEGDDGLVWSTHRPCPNVAGPVWSSERLITKIQFGSPTERWLLGAGATPDDAGLNQPKNRL